MRGETSLIRSGRRDPPRARLSLFSDAGSGAVSDWVSGVGTVGLSRDHLLPTILWHSGDIRYEWLFESGNPVWTGPVYIPQRKKVA